MCAELDVFVSFELGRTDPEGLSTVLVDDKDAMLWFDNEFLVNKAKLSGSVNPAIENVDASSSERTLLGTLGALVVVVMNDSASVIGSVEPTTGKLEDWSMVRMPVLLCSEVGEDVLVLLTEMTRLH